MEDLDAEHRQIFGRSLLEHNKRFDSSSGVSSLRYRQRDDWDELVHPRPKYNGSNGSDWSFLDTKKNHKSVKHTGYNYNNERMGAKMLNSYDRAKIEGRKVWNEREEMRHQRELEQDERRKALDKVRERRDERKKIYRKRGRGQPKLNAQVGLLLNRLNRNKNKGKHKNMQQQYDEDSQDEQYLDINDECLDVNDQYMSEEESDGDVDTFLQD